VHLNPITRSSFIATSICPHTTTGLIIELGDKDHSEDTLKVEEFIKDPGFEFYRNAAHKFGFRVDKNAPWRIITDINSPNMQWYMSNYGVKTMLELFDMYYYRAYHWDLPLLRGYLIQFYNSYIEAYPQVKEIRSKSNGTSYVVLSDRMPISETEDLFEDKYWLQYYYLLRIKEKKFKWNNKVIDKEIKKVLDIQKTIDISSALWYINKQCCYLC
jgi:hypothetical protein